MGCGSGSGQVGNGPQGQSAVFTQLTGLYMEAIASPFTVSAVAYGIITGTSPDDNMSGTIVTTGKYLAWFNCYAKNNGADGYIDVKLFNGVTEVIEFYRRQQIAAGKYGVITAFSSIMNCTAGDIITVQAFASNATEIIYNRVFSIFQVRT